jgi:peroxiredoxin
MTFLMQKKLIVAVALVAIAAGAALGYLHRAAAPQAEFVALSGANFSTADLRGRVVLVNFWATTCTACLEEMPKMVEAWKKYSPRGYEMVAVAMSYDHPNAVAEFARSRALPFRVALDPDGEVARSFGNVVATPTTILLDRRGRVVARYLGEPDWQDFHARVERALGEPA